MEDRRNGSFEPGTWAAWREQNEGYKMYGPSGENGFVFVDQTKESFRTGAGSGQKRKRKNGGKKAVSLLLVVLLAFGAGFGGGIAAISMMGGVSSGGGQTITIDPSDASVGEAIAAKVIPSVVGISTTREVSGWSFFGITTQELPEGVGTGIIVSENGYIVTNSHVVSDGKAKTITVSFNDGTEMPGTVLWNDSTLDLAVVKVQRKGLTAAELGDSDQVRIGSYAAAIGNPLGLTYDRTMTQGGISGLDRTIQVSGGAGSSVTTMEGLIQTDAAINSGNSGGPLLNSQGQVIGINSAKASAGEGMGFAIPINVVKPILQEVMDKGTYKKAYIGISGNDASLYLQYYPDVDLGTKTGVYVTQVYTGSAAAVGGIKEGDVITALDGKEIETMTELTRQVYNYKSGDQVKVTLFREGKKMSITLTLGAYEG